MSKKSEQLKAKIDQLQTIANDLSFENKILLEIAANQKHNQNFKYLNVDNEHAFVENDEISALKETLRNSKPYDCNSSFFNGLVQNGDEKIVAQQYLFAIKANKFFESNKTNLSIKFSVEHINPDTDFDSSNFYRYSLLLGIDMVSGFYVLNDEFSGMDSLTNWIGHYEYRLNLNKLSMFWPITLSEAGDEA